jgi:hypothetical protein
MSRKDADTIWMSSSAMNIPTHIAAKAQAFCVEVIAVVAAAT